MALGLLMAGIGFGAAVAGVWVASGGSLIMGFALYSLAATVFVLGFSTFPYFVSEWRQAAEHEKAKTPQPAE